MPESPSLGRCGRYELLEPIGAGGMGEIFRARDGDGRVVAIKRLLPGCAKDPIFIGMFLDEARLLQRLSHPNVCEVFEHGNDNHRYFLVMEHIEGVSLRQLLDARGGKGLPLPLACRIIAEVASALDYAHRLTDDKGRPLGVVHRDVSPGNIMIGADGQVKLVDFGLAKARTQLMKTQPGLVKGKFGYLAPEQLQGQVDWRTDLFALGLCFYEALTGAPLFGQQTAAATVAAIRGLDAPPPVAGMLGAPATLDQVMARALAPVPENRFESAAAFRAALGKVVLEAGHGSVTAEDVARVVKQASKAGASVPPPQLSAAELGDEPELGPPCQRSRAALRRPGARAGGGWRSPDLARDALRRAWNRIAGPAAFGWSTRSRRRGGMGAVRTPLRRVRASCRRYWSASTGGRAMRQTAGPTRLTAPTRPPP